MMEYRYGSHTVFDIQYHFVWVTKYRYKVLAIGEDIFGQGDIFARRLGR